MSGTSWVYWRILAFGPVRASFLGSGRIYFVPLGAHGAVAGWNGALAAGAVGPNPSSRSLLMYDMVCSRICSPLEQHQSESCPAESLPLSFYLLANTASDMEVIFSQVVLLIRSLECYTVYLINP